MEFMEVENQEARRQAEEANKQMEQMVKAMRVQQQQSRSEANEEDAESLEERLIRVQSELNSAQEALSTLQSTYSIEREALTDKLADAEMQLKMFRSETEAEGRDTMQQMFEMEFQKNQLLERIKALEAAKVQA